MNTSVTTARKKILLCSQMDQLREGRNQGGETVGEGSGAVEVTTSSMVMEIKAVTEALKHLQQQQYTRAGCHHHRLYVHPAKS